MRSWLWCAIASSAARTIWARPGTKLGFFTHMGGPFAANVFALMWGVPYLTTAQGLSRELAGASLTLSVVTFVVVVVALAITATIG